MPRKQFRRAVSVKRGTYDRLKVFAEANHVSMSSIIEALVEPYLTTKEAKAEEAKAKEAVTHGG